MPNGGDDYSSVEEAWVYNLGEIMPTPEEISENPMAALRAFFYAGATSGIDIAFRMGFVGVSRELKAWGEGKENDDGTLR